jgi:poly-gamma-glutamate synthesis protein (capsule biosynthesis protein)
MGWYQSGQPDPVEPSVSFTFVGDIMLDRGIRNAFDPFYTKVTDTLGDRVLWGTHLVVGNLEGPFTNAVSNKRQDDRPVFRFNPAAIELLEFLKVSAVSTANNHSEDAGIVGVNDTIDILAQNDISVVREDASLSVSGFNMQIRLHVSDQTRLSAPVEHEFNSAPDIFDVAYVHWGPEYHDTPSIRQSEIAHKMINDGADMIIGVGPHVIQPVELYKGRPIFYSLGNFIFDFENDERLTTGMVLSGIVRPDSIEIVPSLVQARHLKPLLLRSQEADKKLESYFDESLMEKIVDRRGGLRLRIPR